MSRLLLVILFSAVALSPATARAQSDSVFAVSRSGTSLLRVNVDGNVGVGTSDPRQRLTVNGGVQADSASVSRVRFADGSSVSSMRITPLSASYAAGWQNFSTFTPMSYYLDPAGIVHLEGAALYTGSGGQVSTLFFVLPEGYRPARNQLAAVASDQPVIVVIRSNGNVTVEQPSTGGISSGTLLSLTGTAFLAAP
jgi:hypothetical protein